MMTYLIIQQPTGLPYSIMQESGIRKCHTSAHKAMTTIIFIDEQCRKEMKEYDDLDRQGEWGIRKGCIISIDQ